jgi:hypothetical protein
MGAGGTSTTLGGGVISRTGAGSGGSTTIALVSGFGLGFGGGSRTGVMGLRYCTT